MARDELFKTNKIKRSGFVFDDKVADVFDDMAARSIPFYSEIQRMIVEISGSFVCKNSNVYDIGCSTGTTLLKLAKHIRERGVKFVGIDFSEAMLAKAENKLKKHDISCEFIKKDINQDFEITNASVVIMNLVLQFVKPANRHSVISNVYKGLRKGGCLIFVEKILHKDKCIDSRFTDFYYRFKERNNYTKNEILNKKESLEKVLIPNVNDENIKRLKDNGFKIIDVFFKWYNFCGIVAVKE